MGIACALIRLSDETIEALLRDPRQIFSFLGYDEAPAPSSGGFLARLFGKRPEQPAPASPQMEVHDEDDESDVDKAWNGIHYLLTGEVEETAHPLGFLVSGGQPIGKEDVGYGPARAFSSTKLAAICDQLAPLSRETLHTRYQPKEMDRAGVYPEIWARDGDDGFEYLFSNFEQMREFFQEARRRKWGMLIYFC